MSYSDSEGGQAGVGVSIFSSLAPRPRAAFATVPDVIRRLWARRAGIGVYHDTLLVEAIAPSPDIMYLPPDPPRVGVGSLHR